MDMRVHITAPTSLTCPSRMTGRSTILSQGVTARRGAPMLLKPGISVLNKIRAPTGAWQCNFPLGNYTSNAGQKEFCVRSTLYGCNLKIGTRMHRCHSNMVTHTYPYATIKKIKYFELKYMVHSKKCLLIKVLIWLLWYAPPIEKFDNLA